MALSFFDYFAYDRYDTKQDFYGFKFVRSRLLSTEASSYSPLNWWRGRQERNEAEKYRKRIAEMADTDVWTIGPMFKDVEEAAKSWTAKLVDNKEAQAVKHMQKVLEGLISIVGKEAQADRIINLSRKEKLEAAIAAGTSVEEINMVIKQVQTHSLLHRIVRKRKLEGKSIPETSDAMQQIVKLEMPKVWTKEEKQRMMKKQARQMKRR